jgi:ribosomal protein S18 acetylase RimI-like enzyme
LLAKRINYTSRGKIEITSSQVLTMEINIRDGRPEDAEGIADFNSKMAVETENHHLDPELIGGGVSRLLADNRHGRYWVADLDGSVVGQIMVTYEFSDWRNGVIWWIQSVYVRKDMRRKGIYTSLYRHVETLARADDNVVAIRLYVDRDNKRAQDTYRKLGMDMTDYLVMQTAFRS